MYKKHKDRQYLVCFSGMGSILCRKMQYFWKCQSEPHFLTPGQSEVMPGQMPGCSYATDWRQIYILIESFKSIGAINVIDGLTSLYMVLVM